MLLLALDTSTSAVTAALHDGRGVLASSSVDNARGHAELLAPTVAAVLDEAGRARTEVTHVVAGTGPGPFTGLRVGIVTALTFGYALDLPVHGLCSLDALAHRVWRERGAEQAPDSRLVVATDARRREVYWAQYAIGSCGARRTAGPDVGRPADIAADVAGIDVAGRGALLYPDCFGESLGILDVDAADLADLAVRRLDAGEPLPAPEPLYLRRPDAVPQTSTKSVLRSGR